MAVAANQRRSLPGRVCAWLCGSVRCQARRGPAREEASGRGPSARLTGPQVPDGPWTPPAHARTKLFSPQPSPTLPCVAHPLASTAPHSPAPSIAESRHPMRKVSRDEHQSRRDPSRHTHEDILTHAAFRSSTRYASASDKSCDALPQPDPFHRPCVSVSRSRRSFERRETAEPESMAGKAWRDQLQR